MLVGLLEIELFIPNSDSIKAKRYVLKSLKDRLRNRFNISVAETDYHDKWQRALIGVSVVSNETKHIDSVFENVLNFIYEDYRIQIIHFKKTYL
jgi:uncharacterized protein